VLSLVATPAISSLRVNASCRTSQNTPRPFCPPPHQPWPWLANYAIIKNIFKPPNLSDFITRARCRLPFCVAQSETRQHPIVLYSIVPRYCTLTRTSICTQLGTSTQARLQHGQTPPRCSNQAWIGQRTQRAQRAQRFRRYRPSPHMNDSMPATS
jgi:hypothetical protein